MTASGSGCVLSDSSDNLGSSLTNKRKILSNFMYFDKNKCLFIKTLDWGLYLDKAMLLSIVSNSLLIKI